MQIRAYLGLLETEGATCGSSFSQCLSVIRSFGVIHICVEPPSMWGNVEDPDMKNIWWKAEGVNPNDIIPATADPIGGSQGWYDTVVKVTPAKAGDKFGDIKVDNKKHFEFYKETMQYAYTGSKHREMHPEVKAEKLPPAELKMGH